ncbi:arsenite efflux transporter metallochaperone ArsD [Nigerium sp.]|uniref:arsenite efflux transporter metallochaperone ArsD n=1 Tax=Nigerium sp. TaxID=2042655 RepID=UPI0032219340
MTTISVFEGPLCCNTGVCGPDLDQRLVDFTADAAWLTSQGARVVRANLAQDPTAFAEDAHARAFLQTAGADGLPLVVVDGVTALTGRYPTRAELARFAGLEAASEGNPGTAAEQPGAQACCTPDDVASGACCSTTSTTIPLTDVTPCCADDAR